MPAIVNTAGGREVTAKAVAIMWTIQFLVGGIIISVVLHFTS